MIKITEIIVTTKELAELFGYSEKYISELVSAHGLPKSGHNQFNLTACIKWILKYSKELFEREVEKIKSTKAQDTLALKNAEYKDLLIKEKNGQLISKDDVMTEWLNELNIIIANLDGFPFKTAALLRSLSDEKEIIKILESEINKLKSRIAATKLDIPE